MRSLWGRLGPAGIALVAGSVWLAGCGGPAPEPSGATQSSSRQEVDPATRSHALAQQYAKNGEYEQAEIQYKKGLAMDPVNIAMMRGLADVYMKLAARTKETLKAEGAAADTGLAVIAYYNKAVAVYDEAILLEPKNPEIREGRAYVLTAEQRYDEAIEEYKKVLELKSADPAVYINLGYTYQKKGDVDESVRAYSKAVELDPGDRDTVLRIARTLYDSGRESESTPWFAKAYELDPSDTSLGRFLGALYIRAKEYDKAAPVYASLVEQDPEDWRLYLNYGVALEKTDRIDEALAAYGEVLRINPEKVEVYFQVADLLVNAERYQEALDFAERGLARAPDMANGYASKGKALEKLGTSLGGEKKYAQALERYQLAKGTFQKGLALNDPRFNDYFKKQIDRQDQLVQRIEAQAEMEEYGYE